MTKLIELTEIVLFDWGNTLMVDFPEAQGKMCDWEVVEEVAGAREVLAALSKSINSMSQPMPLTRQNKISFKRLNELVCLSISPVTSVRRVLAYPNTILIFILQSLHSLVFKLRM